MAEISSQMITELRSRTQAGIKDCKKALIENNGDMAQAIEWLRKRGITKAGDKADRVTAEGIVHSYIHFGSRIGVLVELNCETDFVAKREEFKELADNIAKQIAACPGVEYVSIAHIPPEIVEKEKAIEASRAQEDKELAKKPPAVQEKIVQGRVEKRLKEMSLLDQPYIKDQSITIDELIKQTVAVLKENIRVRRFVRYSVGEEIPGEVTPTLKAQTPSEPPQASDKAETASPEPAQVSDAVETVSPEPAQVSDAVETVSPEPAQVSDAVETVSPEPAQVSDAVETVSPEPAQVSDAVETVSPEPAQVTDAVETVSPEPAQATEETPKPAAKSKASSKKKKK